MIVRLAILVHIAVLFVVVSHMSRTLDRMSYALEHLKP
jgi:hypothetical protein